MSKSLLSRAFVLLLIATQILGPGVLWAAEQRGIQIEANDRIIISALNEGTLIGESSNESRTLHFGDAVNVGEQIKTGDNTMAEVLIGNRVVVTLGMNTTAQLTTLNREQATLQVNKGIVRVAASSEALGEEGLVIIQTPTNQVRTRGGIVRVMIKTPNDSIVHQPREAKLHYVSFTPYTLVAALDADGDIIQIEEGTAEIPEAGPGGESLTMHSGQSMTFPSEQTGSVAELEPQDNMRTGVLANTKHSDTPQEGLDNLIALQVDQATQLGQALTGAEKTGQDESGKGDDSENVINGATGGVQVANVVSTLFSNGNASDPGSSNPVNSLGGGFSKLKSNGTEPAVGSTQGYTVSVNGGEKPLLIFTKQEPVQTHFNGAPCGLDCVGTVPSLNDLEFVPLLPPVTSKITVERELVLVGGIPNNFHGGIAPIDRLIVRGVNSVSNIDIPATTTNDPFQDMTGLSPLAIREANSTFVFREGLDQFGNSTLGVQGSEIDTFVGGGGPLYGGILGQFSNDSAGPATTFLNLPTTEQLIGKVTRSIEGLNGKGVTGAITATGANVILTGGVTLDRGTVATIGETAATKAYFTSPGGPGAMFTDSAALFSGSLLAVIDGQTGPAAVTVEDRLLGVYDGSEILIPENGENKALLSVLDAKLKGPPNIPLIEINNAFKDADMSNGSESGDTPKVTVTSAVVTRSTIPLDSALVEASAPLLALTQATMTTNSHFADLAGNQATSIQLNKDALVALNASQLMINNGHLLNLFSASATVEGFLFSLNDTSSLTIADGTLFSLNEGSALNLTASAFGVFGNGNNTLAITNDLCATACGTLVNSANNPFMLPNGSPLQAAGVTQNVVLPDGFKPFALADGAPTPNITVEGALFEVNTGSTLTINQTAVVN